MRDPIEALEAELALVKDERDNWKEEAMLKATEAEAFMLQRDALAASLQDIRIAASFAAPGFAEEIKRRTADPTTSLAHLKAQWQAEALEDYRARRYGRGCSDYWEFQRVIDELRRQAEEK